MRHNEEQAQTLIAYCADVVAWMDAQAKEKVEGDDTTGTETKDTKTATHKTMVDLYRSAGYANEHGQQKGHLLLIRVLERVRRIAAEYGAFRSPFSSGISYFNTTFPFT